MNKLNVIWILIDSARNFETDIDDRGMPAIISKFSKKCIYYKNVVTSAPSTIMSVSSIMTSTPSYLHSRSYDNFPDITKDFDTFPSVLKDEGYNINGVIYFKHGRELLSNLFGKFNTDFLPKKLSNNKPVWTNKDVYGVFKKLLELNDWTIPSLNYLHYNVRVDDNVSEIVEKTLEDIERKGLFENSIIIINSDHGYPLPNRGWDSKMAKKQGWGHDQLLYNDNILTPVLIRYPGVSHKVVEEYVSTLDIVPTILSKLGIPISKKFHGLDLFSTDINIIKERTLRTDNRYCGQLPQGISVIKDNKKFISFLDLNGDEEFELFDLAKDPEEKNNLIENPSYKKWKEELYKEHTKIEDNYLGYHCDFLKSRWGSHIEKIKIKPNKIAIIIKSTTKFEEIVFSIFRNLFPESKLILINNEESCQEKFDLGITIIESEVPWHFKKIKNNIQSISVKNMLYLDNNGVNLGRYPLVVIYKRFFGKRLELIRGDRRYFFDLIKRVFREKLLEPVKS